MDHRTKLAYGLNKFLSQLYVKLSLLVLKEQFFCVWFIMSLKWRLTYQVRGEENMRTCPRIKFLSATYLVVKFWSMSSMHAKNLYFWQKNYRWKFLIFWKQASKFNFNKIINPFTFLPQLIYYPFWLIFSI